MTLPPERITIKRRREDEPVDALYLEQKRHCSSSATFWFRALEEKKVKPSDVAYDRTSKPQAQAHKTLRSNNHSPKQQERFDEEARAPKVQERGHSSRDIRDGPSSVSSSGGRAIPNIQTGAIQGIQKAAKRGEVPSARLVPSEQRSTVNGGRKEPRALPRTFHLSASSKAITPPSMVSMHGIRKRYNRRHDFVVFEEKIKTSMVLTGLNAEVRKEIDRSDQSTGGPETRQENGAGSRIRRAVIADREPPAIGRLYKASDKNGARLEPQKVRQHTEHQSSITSREPQERKTSDVQLQQKIKFQPKPPRARPEANLPVPSGSRQEVLLETQYPENADDFVYDTYFRTSQPAPGFQYDGLPATVAIADEKVGVLVIAEDDEAIWEAYAEDAEESEKDWNSEEEDENAEDFYGNDYPEDELDSDDEYGRAAYRYRGGASDDEEFDVDRTSWSDDEDGAADSWKHNAWD